MVTFHDGQHPATRGEGREPDFSLSRQDLVACVAAYRLGNRSPAIWGPGIGVIGGLALGVALIALAENLGWAAWLQPAFFMLGWVIALVSFAIVHRRTGQLRRRCQWVCPHCSSELIASRGFNPAARAEMAIASGRCPICGEPLFAGEG